MPPLAASTAALLLADARLPSGGHAHSAGVEPAVTAGVDAGHLGAFLHGRAARTTLVEAGTAVAARSARLSGGDLDTVEAAWAARTPSRALRDAARVLARGYLRVGGTLLPGDEVIAAWRERPVPPPRPCVLGVIAAGLDVPALELARLVVYEDMQAAAAAILKLEPRDPLDLVSLVVELCSGVEDRLPAIAAITDPADIPALTAPQSEAWAEAHARSTRRLFRA
ncbi:urease accessory protein UreF [Microbacterium ureisolvens]|uniref:Urease accessory protein n=1 Tax=Microbacterium ureisolvens TaxID=2781186 RepID=A0ABS7HUJ0_9MICO|nr:urease accessory UreF family protein [Microbacterium ureisolvens]MBW9108470.1 urease accessory protein [Microbacterium ureisolvens]